MKFMVFVFLVVLSVVRAQFNYIGFMSPWSNAFAPQGNSLSGLQAVRDPRLNTGPVVFPSPPPNAIEENSGVVVGASGYGFVPPNSQAECIGRRKFDIRRKHNY